MKHLIIISLVTYLVVARWTRPEVNMQDPNNPEIDTNQAGPMDGYTKED